MIYLVTIKRGCQWATNITPIIWFALTRKKNFEGRFRCIIDALLTCCEGGDGQIEMHSLDQTLWQKLANALSWQNTHAFGFQLMNNQYLKRWLKEEQPWVHPISIGISVHQQTWGCFAFYGQYCWTLNYMMISYVKLLLFKSHHCSNQNAFYISSL